MSGLLKKVLALLCICVLLSASFACAEDDPLGKFRIKHGPRDSKKIAITVDDCWKTATEYIERDVELCREYGIHITFFPVGYEGCLEPEYRDLWQSVLDAGCEIGSHTNRHVTIGAKDNRTILAILGNWQEALDKTLGYHYPARWVRPPYGSIADEKNNSSSEARVTKMLKLFGYDHIVHWEISETKSLDKVMKQVKNGSILLFHATHKDTAFLEKLIPMLLEAGYEPVTVSEMFGMDPVETSDELYVYDRSNYGL